MLAPETASASSLCGLMMSALSMMMLIVQLTAACLLPMHCLTYCLSTTHTLLVYCLSTTHALLVYYPCTACLLPMHCLSTTHALLVYCLSTTHALLVYYPCTACLLLVYYPCTACLLFVYYPCTASTCRRKPTDAGMSARINEDAECMAEWMNG